MNNKGFAISTILYGLMILFIFLFLSLLGILSQQKNNIEKLIENTNGARYIVSVWVNALMMSVIVIVIQMSVL